MSSINKKLLGIEIPQQSKENILEKVAFFLQQKEGMKHVTSLNPENLVIAQEDREFRLILQSADVKLIDGFGVVLAAKLRQIPVGERYTGVDFMIDMLQRLSDGSSRVLFLGGKPHLAENLAECYEKKYPKMVCKGLNGIKDIKKYQYAEEGESIIKEIHAFKPQIIFAAFGSPFQEKWFWDNRDRLKGIVCVGVGGAFDFIGGTVSRAPRWIGRLGLEWLYRLIRQPWRWRRQLRLLRFIYLVLTGA